MINFNVLVEAIDLIEDSKINEGMCQNNNNELFDLEHMDTFPNKCYKASCSCCIL